MVFDLSWKWRFAPTGDSFDSNQKLNVDRVKMNLLNDLNRNLDKFLNLELSIFFVKRVLRRYNAIFIPIRRSIHAIHKRFALIQPETCFLLYSKLFYGLEFLNFDSTPLFRIFHLAFG